MTNKKLGLAAKDAEMVEYFAVLTLVVADEMYTFADTLWMDPAASFADRHRRVMAQIPQRLQGGVTVCCSIEPNDLGNTDGLRFNIVMAGQSGRTYGEGHLGSYGESMIVPWAKTRQDLYRWALRRLLPQVQDDKAILVFNLVPEVDNLA